MITKEQAIQAGERQGTEFHAGRCFRLIGPRGGVTNRVTVYRSNGKCKTWKTRPEDFSLPIKHGFNGPYAYITNQNAGHFHLAEDCERLGYLKIEHHEKFMVKQEGG